MGEQESAANSRSSLSEKTSLNGSKENDAPRNVQLDTGIQRVRLRHHWWQLWIPRLPPPPPRTSLNDAPIIPLTDASILAQLTYTWITDIMVLGYQRTLQASDLWKMDDSRLSGNISDRLDAAWARRVEEANTWNKGIACGDIHPSLIRRLTWVLRSLPKGTRYSQHKASLLERWRKADGLKQPSLAWALNDTLGNLFWIGGAFKVFGDTTQLMGPLLVKAIINFGKARSAREAAGAEPPNIGQGIAMAIGLFCIVIVTSICQHQFFWRSMTTGVLARAALINSIYKRGVHLTGKSRAKLPNSALVNHISTDVSRIDACAQWFHPGWTAPIQVTVCLIILLVQLGPSALAGFSLFLLIAPIQERVMALQFTVRRRSMKFTDQRAKTLLEALAGMRVVKYFCYEVPFLKRVFEIRTNELLGISKIQNFSSANIAFAYSTPVLAATLAFLTYTLTTDGFDVAVIFASLSLFQLLRQPMMFLPRSLSAVSDAKNALGRLSNVFHAEIITEAPFVTDPDQNDALIVKDATFEWEAVAISNVKYEKGDDESVTQDVQPFQVKNVSMNVPRGSLVGIVGRVGSGKSSLLQGLIGEMRRVQGEVSFCGRIAYCPQVAWIQNATLRDNILFGQPFDEDRYWQAIEDACLSQDLLVLSDGDLTEIGEKGINLSGGQKQRVNIARALYFGADIIIFDDPLSALDAHVGKTLFHGAILGSLRAKGKAVILVTHALHFLPYCDHIYTMESGNIAEHGTYQELIAKNGEFARLDKEFGGGHEETQEEDITSQTPTIVDASEEAKSKSARVEKQGAGTGKLEGRLMVNEKRTTGSVSWSVYWTYLKAGRGYIAIPLIVASIILMQSSQILNSYTLVWWQANSFGKPFSFYQILYACLGLSQATFTFFLGLSVNLLSMFVSRNLHHDSVRNIFFAPMSFFDTTPMGRVLGVFGKDIDAIDNQLPVSMRMFILTMSNVFGAVLVITIVEHYFIIAAVVLALGYNYFAAFYRSSARELKRLDAMLRSVLYSHFSESLTGLPTIRSYGEMPRFIRDNSYYIDLENRALFLTVTTQRWLAIRLDFLGSIMVFIVALLAIVGISGISPAEIGLVLTYTTSLTQLCGLVTRQSAEVENYMNSVERVVHYSRGDLIEQEAPYEIEATKPPTTWPTHGAIKFRDVFLSYRPGLPQVLRGISLDIRGGEKIGIVGRTGAGKSSLALALLRIVECTGSITIDGVDISHIGLKDLRANISIIPQEPLLFSGTVRSNLDPFSLYDDAILWDALRRSSLLGNPSGKKNALAPDVLASSHAHGRIGLDSVIEPEGANLSVGERSLLSLARALVKDARVVILDEATASVDLETDSKIQETIQSEFRSRTLLCIAHRLRTIISYDRILVLDGGSVAEFDTPSSLFCRSNSIFRTLCDRSNITLSDIEHSQATIPHTPVV
ncbi:ABC protein [Pleurotus eryngii]|uniref:ABC protein n=1 Tax=Pleurotus eryngii TaxID=5323 RepID=A0A9P5ZM41_PLEER|nr:ABC protein [Pleurotus eryngii]